MIELTINPHELPSSQRPFLTIVGTSDLELELIVPSRLINAVRVSTEFQFVIDETQRSYRARVSRAAGVVDAVSQTLKLYAALIDQDAEIIPGMSGTAQFANRDGR